VSLLARHLLVPLFAKDAAVIAIGLSAMPVLAIAQPFMATSIVLSQTLRGAGHTRTVLAVSTLGAFVVRLSATWFFAIRLGLGLPGIWLGSTCDWAVRSAILVPLAARTIRKPA
jgi:Na+-driven multidrug efflux pump